MSRSRWLGADRLSLVSAAVLASVVLVSACAASSGNPVDVVLGPDLEVAAPREVAPSESVREARDEEPITFEAWSDRLRERARASATPVAVLVCADWLAACPELERDVWTDGGVRAAARAFILARLDVSAASRSDDEARRALGAEHVPALVLIDPSGARVERWRRDDLDAPSIASALREFGAR
ncbi:MAG: thioredoxin family protein [Polyangiaceae bacterium]